MLKWERGKMVNTKMKNAQRVYILYNSFSQLEPPLNSYSMRFCWLYHPYNEMFVKYHLYKKVYCENWSIASLALPKWKTVKSHSGSFELKSQHRFETWMSVILILKQHCILTWQTSRSSNIIILICFMKTGFDNWFLS